MTNLYRHYDVHGRLLYVGIALSIADRTSQHMQGSAWADRIATIHVERFPFRWLAMEAEKTAIITERPEFNVVHNIAQRAPTPRHREQFKNTAHRRAYMRDLMRAKRARASST